MKKGDQVLVITGKDKGRKGKVLSVSGEKALVEGVNLKKKHVRPKTSGKKGETIETAAPIAVSNLKVICPKCGKGSRFGIREGNRFCKSCKQDI